MTERERFLKVIPEPKIVEFKNADFCIKKDTTVLVSAQDRELNFIVSALQEGLEKSTKTKLTVQTKRNFGELKNTFFLGVTEDKEMLARLAHVLKLPLPDLQKEGYLLEIFPDKVILLGKDYPGLYYAVQTLLQIAHGLILPGVRIVDWPNLEMRGIHFDFRSPLSMVSPGYLKECIDRISRYKLNTILFEYEDKIIYEQHPGFAFPSALSKEEWRSITEYARQRYISTIPLTQSIGHIEYILKHPGYKHLRENPNEESELCPLKTGSLNLIKEMYAEIAEVAGGSKYFHIGADEAWFLGSCPQCKNNIKDKGRSMHFIDYINKIGRVVKEMGKRPVIWHDMLTFLPEDLSRLDRDFVIAYWEYNSGEEELPHVVQRHYGWLVEDNRGSGYRDERHSDVVFKPIKDIPSHIRQLYQDYWKGTRKGLFRAFPYTDFFQDKGFSVIACPATRGSGHIFPNYHRHIPNIMGFSREAYKKGTLGVITTSWSWTHIPFEHTWYGILCAAEFNWSPEGNTREEFDDKFTLQFFGTESDDLIKVHYLLSTDYDVVPIRKKNLPSLLLVKNPLQARENAVKALELIEKNAPQAMKGLSTLDFMKLAAHLKYEEAENGLQKGKR